MKVLSYIVGTWNFVNTTSNDGTRTSATTGTITFKGGGYDQNSGSSAPFIETINGKIVHAIIDCDIINGKTVCRPIGNTSGVWTSDGYTLGLSYYGGPAPTLTFITTSPNHMELTDEHGDTSDEMRWHIMMSNNIYFLDYHLMSPVD